MSSSPLYALRINPVELLRQPGTERPISLTVSADDLGVSADVAGDRITGDVVIDLRSTSSTDGILIGGDVAVPWRAPCRRCLADVVGVSHANVEELFQYDVTEDDANQIEGDQIDLAPIVREYVLLELPEGPLCRDACAGICPVCGIDRNKGSCDCDTTVRDARWAALEGLTIDDPEQH